MTALSGNYVNFGVFELYGDRALVDVLDIIVKMILSIPLADVFAFRKVSLKTWDVIHLIDFESFCAFEDVRQNVF